VNECESLEKVQVVLTTDRPWNKLTHKVRADALDSVLYDHSEFIALPSNEPTSTQFSTAEWRVLVTGWKLTAGKGYYWNRAGDQYIVRIRPLNKDGIEIESERTYFALTTGQRVAQVIIPARGFAAVD
jgi:hypothetical protein